MNIFTAYVIFDLQQKMPPRDFNRMRLRFLRLLEHNNPEKAGDYLSIMENKYKDAL